MGKIPKDQYVKAHGYPVITKKLLELYHQPHEIEAFSRWFCGQTGIIAEDGTHAVYAWDYERWLKEGRLDHQLPGSWD